ncbi:restriction endonuclease subunit S [Vibrio sp. S12_S33]|uniref:restriction endonuclease subunit S n=1 Tax=Vibrio sp. S12_S33 TaxID=2720223 RepID=UPI00177D1529|nr:restriction endonuclease subunit S [Vibrio sp. S12_S33]MBD1566934.1 restriction endonuclease subunit S [Vibrio sp. S12_S33]
MVPNGWEVKSLSSITKWSSGGTPSKNNPDYWNGEIPWISAASMRGHYFEKSELRITDLAVGNGAKMAPKDSLLLLVRGSMLWNKIPVGITAKKVSFNQDVKCLVPHADELTTEFLLYWFLTYEHRLMNMVTGTGIGAGKLDTSDLQSLDVFLPPLPEQRKIAQILSTWDRGIATTEKLIDASKQQKKALMQQLLTGKKRLIDPETGKAFEGDWEEVKLGDISYVTTGNSNREDSSLDAEYTFFDRSEDIRKSSRYLFDSEAVIVAGEGQDFIPKYFKGKFDLHQRTYAIMNFEKSVGKFLYYYIGFTRHYFLSQAVGSTVKSLRLPMFQKMPIQLPSKDEQQKIASVLTAADKDIELLEAKLAHFKQEKKALMQQLLTGKRRVKVNEVA